AAAEGASIRNTLSRTGWAAPVSLWPVSAMRRTCCRDWARPASASTRSLWGFSMAGILAGDHSRPPGIARHRGIGGSDHRAPQAGRAVVQHQRLPRGRRPLRAEETHRQAAVVQHPHPARLFLLAVADLGAALELRRRRRALDPV